jgi:asparagine synthase (glutamine-hydrolysing)
LAPDGLPFRQFRLVRDWARFGSGGMAIRNSAFGSHRLPSMMSHDSTIDLSEREAVLRHFADGQPLDTLLRLDQEIYLVSVLHRQDRVSMGASIEARVPFLDHHVIETANRLPLEAKLSAHAGKAILRRAARTLIPDVVIDRLKMGFPVPLGEWFRGRGTFPQRLDLLLDSQSTVAAYLDKSCVRRLVHEHRSRLWDHSEDLWILLTLEMWQRRFLGRPPHHHGMMPTAPLAC